MNPEQEQQAPDQSVSDSTNSMTSPSRPVGSNVSTPLRPGTTESLMDSPPELNRSKDGKSWKVWVAIIAAILLLIGVIVTIMILVSSGDAANDNTKPRAKVGVMLPFTGGSSSMGYGSMKGVQLAKKELRASNIEIVQADSRCEPEKARSEMTRLARQGVIAVIGDGCSSAVTAALPSANSSRVPLISPSASSASLSIPNDYFFRVIPSDNFQSEYMAQAMYNRGVRKAAVLYTNEPYGANMNTIFKTKFKTSGGEIVATAHAETDDIELAIQARQLAAAKPDAVFIAANSLTTAAASIQAIRTANKNIAIYGGDIFYDQTVIKNAPGVSEGVILTSFYRGTADFKRRVKQEFQTTDQLYGAAQSYDAFHAIYKAVQMGAKSGEEVKAKLSTMSFEGVSGNMSFDRNGEVPGARYKYDLLQIKDGTFVEVEQ